MFLQRCPPFTVLTKALALRIALSHLDQKGSYVRTLHPLQFCLQLHHSLHTHQEAPRQAHQPFSAQLDPEGLDQHATGSSTIPRDASLPWADWRSTHRSNANVKFADGTAPIIIINNEMAYRERTNALTSWFRTTRSPSSENSVFTPHTTTHTLTSHFTSLHRWTHSACLSVCASFVFFLFNNRNILVYFNIFFLILHLFFLYLVFYLAPGLLHS